MITFLARIVLQAQGLILETTPRLATAWAGRQEGYPRFLTRGWKGGALESV